jgi:MinD-like ATPase involved in chromosome partitioning or flagellar assembly
MPGPRPRSAAIPVVLALGGAAWESEVAQLLDQARDVHLVRRCMDVVEAVSVARAGSARLLLVSADLYQLDRDLLAQVQACGVAVLGLAAVADHDAVDRLHGLGVRTVTELPRHDPGPVLLAGIRDALRADRPGAGAPPDPGGRVGVEPGLAWAHAQPADPLPPGSPATTVEPPVSDQQPGRLLTVWGPTGAPGRTSLAVTLAHEVAAAGQQVLLVDADCYGGAVAVTLGLLEEAPGLLAACRRATSGCSLPQLRSCARALTPSLHVLTGATRADRWTELRPAALEQVLRLARSAYDLVVVDVGFSLERDDELAVDGLTPRRNAATLVSLALADVVVAVGSADPVGLGRLVRGLDDLADVGVHDPVVVANRVRASVLGHHPEEQVAAALARFAGVTRTMTVPDDPLAFDAAVRAGVALAEAAPRSKARAAIRQVAGLILDLGSSPAARAAERAGAG